MDGEVLHYRIERKLGAGGMGQVYLATDTKLERPVALKFLVSLENAPDDARERLIREARAASRLSHPNILTIYAVEEADGQDFIAMEFIDGETLREHAAAQRDLTFHQVLDLLVQVAEGLAAAHEQGVVHRDVKPDNVLVDAAGRVKVMDFGLSKVAGATPLTQEGAAVGTLSYMSPEQARGMAVDARSDVFSFGIVLYELVAGRSPFRSDPTTPVTAIHSILNDTPEPLARYKADVPASLQAVIDKALEKDREYRYQNMRDVIADLRRVRRELDSGSVVLSRSGVAAAVTTALEASAPEPAANRKAWLIPAALLACVAAFGIVKLVSGEGAGDAPPGPERPGSDTTRVDRPGVERDGAAEDTARTGSPRIARQRMVQIRGGSPREATFSPDASQIAFVNDDEDGVSQIYLKNVDEGDPLQLTHSEHDCGSPAWSPGGGLIAYELNEGPLEAAPIMEVNSVWVVSPPNGTPRKIAHHAAHPSWSADGETIVFERFGLIGLVDTDGKNERQVPGVGRSVIPLPMRYPTLSPDGRTVGYFETELGPAGDYWIISITGGEPTRLTSDTQIVDRHVWTPDGQRIIFSSGRRGSTTLWSVAVAGGEPEPLTTGAGTDSDVAISADGKQIVYTNAQNSYLLNVLDPETRERRTISESRGGIGSAQFSPDGRHVAYFGGEAAGTQIYVVDSDGKNLVTLTRGEDTMNLFPQWSPDSRWVYYYRRNDDGQDFVRAPVGGGPAQVVRAGWSVNTEIYAQLSPDGQSLIYMKSSGMDEIPKTIIEDLETKEETIVPGILFLCRWHPDGERIAAFDFQGNVVVYEIATRRSTVVGKGYGHEWSADGTRLYLLRQSGDTHTLFSLLPDGSDEREIADLGSFEPLSATIDVSPSGEIVWTQFREDRKDLWIIDLED